LNESSLERVVLAGAGVVLAALGCVFKGRVP